MLFVSASIKNHGSRPFVTAGQAISPDSIPKKTTFTSCVEGAIRVLLSETTMMSSLADNDLQDKQYSRYRRALTNSKGASSPIPNNWTREERKAHDFLSGQSSLSFLRLHTPAFSCMSKL